MPHVEEAALELVRAAAGVTGENRDDRSVAESLAAIAHESPGFPEGVVAAESESMISPGTGLGGSVENHPRSDSSVADRGR